MWIALIIGFIVGLPFATFLFGSPLVAFFGAGNIFFIVALPILGFIQFAARYIFNKNTSTRTRNSMFVFWVFNVISFFFLGSVVARDFNQEGEISQNIKEISFVVDTVQLKMGERVGKNTIFNMDDATIIDDNLVLENINIDFEKSPDNQFRIVQSHFSRGRNSSEIKRLTNAIKYEPIVKENEIIFPADFVVKKGSKWRGQQIRLVLQVPEGKSVQFGTEKRNRLEHYISSHSRWEGKIPPVNWLGVHTWTMQKEKFYSKADASQVIGSDRGFKNFNSVNVKGDIKVNINKGDSFDVKLSGKERYLSDIEMEQIGDILMIEDIKKRHRGSPLKLEITAPDLNSIDIEDTDDVRISGFDGKKLQVKGENSQEVKVFVDVDSLHLNFKRTRSDVRGKGKYLHTKLYRSYMDAEHYVATNAYVQAENTNKIKLEVTDTLRKRLIHGSRISFDIDPKIIIDELQVEKDRKEAERKKKREEKEAEKEKK